MIEFSARVKKRTWIRKRLYPNKLIRKYKNHKKNKQTNLTIKIKEENGQTKIGRYEK